ncbi:hypothetical protein J2X76_005454 [Neorhizobium sp. 2083]|uniref:hypothetical protein n=1 Tax=Neorhizobium sp. 2083 TaxID=2817762 RepID=UPI0028663FE4|nr:hypothetical protein [Neorhizobium sp. 2083]MDR6820257.1 hypothetical protein [Neorhizobium sp. 2083]
MTLKLITVSILSLGLAAGGALAQTSGKGNASSTGTSASDSSDGTKKIDPNATNSTSGAMGNAAGTKDTRTNCAPNLQTKGSATTPDTTGTASVPSGQAGTNTNGQASNC